MKQILGKNENIKIESIIKAKTYKAIVIGASAGGMNAITEALSPLPKNYSLPIIVVQHLYHEDRGGFAKHLDMRIALNVKEVIDKEKIVHGNVYVAPANYHMLVERGETLALTVDDRVNWSRPSIDIFFESAAKVWSDNLIGIILSGANSDGAVGMRLIKEYGGMVIAQDPETAESPEMPRAAILEAKIKTVLSPIKIGEFLCSLIKI